MRPHTSIQPAAVEAIIRKLEKVTRPNAGGNYLALCPFHDDTHPSLSVHPENGYICFGCGMKGSIADLSRRLLGSSVVNKPAIGANRNGRKAPEAPKHWSQADAEADLARRKLKPETIEIFGIITDIKRQRWQYPVASGTRFKAFANGASRGKYHHTKGTENELYGLSHMSSGATCVYVVNGEPSVWACWQCGIPAVCGIYGEGRLPENAAQLLKEHGIDRVVIVYDLDEAGRLAERKVATALRDGGLDVTVLRLPEYLGDGGDVGDLHTWCDGDRAEFTREIVELPEIEADGLPAASASNSVSRFHYTDMGNAKRFVAHNQGAIKYCAPWRNWLIWDGRVWDADRRQTINTLAKDATAEIHTEAMLAKKSSDWRELERHAFRSEAVARHRAMVELAQSEPGISVLPEELDRDPFLLNCANGVVDLRTGKLLPHDPKRLMTKIAAVEYAPDARSQLFEGFLSDVTGGDKATADYLQRVAGYCLTADAREEVFFVIDGPANSGKTTYAETQKAALGTYGMTADFDTFVKRPDSRGPRNDIARLRDARTVTASEVAKDKRLDEALLKQLTGGDTMAARLLYRESEEFKPVCKLQFFANHLPILDPYDSGIWRRVQRIPFPHEVPSELRDPALKRELMQPEHGGAFLAWAVDGCLRWQKEGLNPPQSVREATEEYRGSNCGLRAFFADRCVFDPSSWTQSREVRAECKSWAREAGEDPPTHREIHEALRARGCEPKRRKLYGESTRGWSGIRVKTNLTDRGQ